MTRMHRVRFASLSTACALLVVVACCARASSQTLITDAPATQTLMSTRTPTIAKEIQLGNDYLSGRGVSKDVKQAAYWYEKAAEAGDPEAQEQLGFLYDTGTGVPVDPARAARWYQMAAASGLVSAKTNLGVAYLWGNGVPADAQLAAQLFREAAKKGDGSAATDLGDLYYFGKGVQQDRSEAEHWYTIGAKLHDPVADFDLGTLYSVEDHPHDFAKAAQWLRKSIAGGYIPAIHSLALLLKNHPELAHSDHEALSLFEQSSGYGQWKSSEELGTFYRDGSLVPRDPGTAYYYFQLAILQGGDKPRQELDQALQQLSSELGTAQTAKLDASAQAWYRQHPDALQFLLNKAARKAPPGLAIVSPANGVHAGQLVAIPPSS
jgi:uncharacterized protein